MEESLLSKFIFFADFLYFCLPKILIMKSIVLFLMRTMTILLLILTTNSLFAQGKSIKRIETQEQEAYRLYQQREYKEACDIYIQTTQERTNIQTSKIHLELFIFFLIIIIGFFLYLYLEKQRAFKKLVSKNMQCAERTITLTGTPAFNAITGTDPKDENLLRQLQELFEQQRIFVNKEITLIDLSKQLGTNKTTLSRVINTYLHKSLPTILNEYRINEAIKLLTDKKNNRYKMEVISEMSGYHNRQAFHAAFKKETGLTPNDFRKLSQEKNLNEEI